MKRRKFLEETSKAAAATLAVSGGLVSLSACNATHKAAKVNNPKTPGYYTGSPDFNQAALPYAFDALEPSIDAKTMEIHYTKHAAAYTKNMGEALSQEALGVTRLEQIFADMGKYSVKMRNNAGGHYNHERFWKWMTPGGKAMSTTMAEIIKVQFGSADELKAKMADAAAKRFGSGWAWLVVTADKKLAIGSTPNQDNPLMSISDFKGYPILGVDVWEHAYYLKYQNRRADYFNAWWNLINWPEVEAAYRFAIS